MNINLDHIQSSCKNLILISDRIKTKVSIVAFAIFEKLAAYFLAGLNLIWPLPKASDLEEGSLKSTLRIAARNLLEGLENNNENREERQALSLYHQDKKRLTEVSLKAPTTVFYLSVNYILIPFTLFKVASGSNFLASAINTSNMNKTLSWYCRGKMDEEFLTRYGLIANKSLQNDPIGPYVYGTVVWMTFQAIHEINPALSPSLHAASALAQVPFFQESFLKLPHLDTLNKKCEAHLNHLRARAEKELAYLFTKVFLYANKRFILPKIEQQAEPAWMNNPYLGLAGSFVQEAVEETALDVATKVMDKISKKCAEIFIQGTIHGVKSIVILHYLNRSLTYSVIKHPLIGASHLILSGGLSQDFSDLSLRIGGACTLLATGSPPLALSFVYGPKLVMKFLKLRKRHLKKIGQEDPLLELFGNAIKKVLPSSSPPVRQRDGLPPLVKRAELLPQEEPSEPTNSVNRPALLLALGAAALGAIKLTRKKSPSVPQKPAGFSETRHYEAAFDDAVRKEKDHDALIEEFLSQNKARL